MMSIYFIADTHFSEENIIKYENRPFQGVQDMDDSMIANWNRMVKEEDTVYLVGDFGAGRREALLLDKLKGIKYLIKGNHDMETNDYYRTAGFQEVYDHPIIIEDFWILSHEPL